MFKVAGMANATRCLTPPQNYPGIEESDRTMKASGEEMPNIHKHVHKSRKTARKQQSNTWPTWRTSSDFLQRQVEATVNMIELSNEIRASLSDIVLELDHYFAWMRVFLFLRHSFAKFKNCTDCKLEPVLSYRKILPDSGVVVAASSFLQSCT